MTLGPADYSLLDRPELLRFVFYPRRSQVPGPPGAQDYSIPVEPGVSISCRLYPQGQASPTLLLFHGNGEIASDYDGIATLYHRVGLNLLVADYRGYGSSTGSPTVSTMLRDAPMVFQGLRGTLQEEGYRGPLFLMGRSLGSLSALEIAWRYQEQLAGLILESSFHSIAGLLVRSGFEEGDPRLRELAEADLSKVQKVLLPTLLIHGENDELVPLEEAYYIYETLVARQKRLEVIPGAGHNDLLFLGREQYFKALEEFVRRHSPPG